MPWEKSFDESDIVEQAMEIFWEKGYAATSISDITETTGIKRGSLYNAFEGKDDLFLQALLKYDGEQRIAFIRRMEEIGSASDAISTFFDNTVKSCLNDPDKKGCLLVNTSLEHSKLSTDVQKVVTGAFKDLATFFEMQIKRGQESGEIPTSIEARSTAKALLAMVVGIRVMGRGPFGKTALQQIAEQAKRLIASS